MYACLVCGFPGLDEMPIGPAGEGSFEICPSCGFQFGYDDISKVAAYREAWKQGGYKWWSPTPQPPDWDPVEQLKNIER